MLGAAFPDYYQFVFTPAVIQSLNGIAWWAVMLFVWIAGIELDLGQAWQHRRESGITAGLALGMPLVLGALAALAMLAMSQGSQGWMGPLAQRWQFVLGVGMACAVTALPILILFMEKLEILRQPLGQRILRYASLDDIAIWGVLALILLDWERVGRQAAFLALFALATVAFRAVMQRLAERDRWYLSLVWLAAVALGADWSGLHYMVGAFLAGAVMDGRWFDQHKLDQLRHHVLLVVMPVFFLSTGLRTDWNVGGARGLRRGGLAAGGQRGRQAAGRAPGRACAGLGAGRGQPHRLAAADQGADHDHLRQRAAGQTDHHRRDLHRAAADGRGQHHAHGAAGDAHAGAAEGVVTRAS